MGQSPGTQDRWKENPSSIQSERKGDFFVDSSGIAVISREAPSPHWFETGSRNPPYHIQAFSYLYIASLVEDLRALRLNEKLLLCLLVVASPPF